MFLSFIFLTDGHKSASDVLLSCLFICLSPVTPPQNPTSSIPVRGVKPCHLLGIRRSSASVVRPSVRPSVCLMSRTSALTRKPKGLGRRNFAQGHPRSHATPTPTSRSKGQKSRWGGGILWRRPSRTACWDWNCHL